MGLKEELEPFAEALENMANNLVGIALDRNVTPQSLEHAIRNIANTIASCGEDLSEL